MSLIKTTYAPSTDFNGAKIIAKHGKISIKMPYDFSIDYKSNHISAARLLRIKIKLNSPMVFRQNGDDYYFISSVDDNGNNLSF